MKIDVLGSSKSTVIKLISLITVSAVLSYPVMHGFNQLGNALLLGEMSILHAFGSLIAVRLFFFNPSVIYHSESGSDLVNKEIIEVKPIEQVS